MPLDETTLITKETNMISNPLEILSKMKEYTNSYETLVNGVWDILKLRKIMKQYNQTTKNQLREMLKVNDFDRMYNDWIKTGLIKTSGTNITFSKDSINLVDRYVDFWRNERM